MMTELSTTIQLAHTLVSYLPPAVARAIHASPVPLQAPRAERLSAAVLLADVSGFTALTEKLAAQGSGGAEELTMLLNRYFGRMIGLLEDEGGEVVQFSGDALMAVFPAAAAEPAALGRSVRHAWQAAGRMQEAMAEFATLETSAGSVALGMKIAIGAGEVLAFSVGGVAERWQYIIAGDPLRQVAAAEHVAQRGQTVLSPEAEPLCRPNTLPAQPLQLPDWQAISPECIAALRSYTPSVISYRLSAGQADWLAELRRMSILFLGVGGIDYAAPDGLAQTQRWMQGLQQTVERYEGSLNKLLVDDKGTIGIVLFGAPPLSHEDDQQRAIRCALDLQAVAEDQGLRLAIGVTTGQVFAGPVGSARRREYTVMGDAVNLAARLMGLAGHGGVLSDHSTYQAAQTDFEWQVLPPQTVKGKAAAVRSYRPLSLQSGSRHTGTGQQMVGRGVELARIECLLDESTAGQALVLTIEGETGIGKSRTVSALVERVRRRELTELLGTGDAIEHNTPYRAWAEIMRGYFGLHSGQDPAEQRRRVEQRFSEIAPQLSQRMALLNDLLSLGIPENDLTTALEPQLRQASLAALVVDLLALWAAERPLVLVLEDAHWLDSLSWQLALQAARSLVDLPVLLVLAMRPQPDLPGEHPYRQLLRLQQTSMLTLAPLSTDETSTLAAARLGVRDLQPELAQLIEQRSAGVPFVVEQLTLSLRDAGVLRVVDGYCMLSDAAADLQLPDTVQGLVLNRIDRLPPEQQLSIKVASVIGRSFGLATLSEIYPARQTPEQLSKELDHLIQQDMVVALEQPDALRSHMFKQRVIQEVTYSTLLHAQRRELHERVARWYEEYAGEEQAELYPLLAYHWRHAQHPRRELRYALLATRKLAAEYANTEALGFINRALQLSADHATHYDLLRLRLEIHDRIGDREAQRDDLQQLHTLVAGQGDLAQGAQLASAWADFYCKMSDYPAALQSLEHARALAQQTASLTDDAQCLTLWGQVLEYQGAYRDAKAYHEDALHVYQRIGDQRGEAHNLSRLSNIHRYLGDYVAARDYALQALNIQRALGDRPNEATSLTNLGNISLQLGEVTMAVQYTQQALQIIRSIGDRRAEALTLATMGWGHFTQGDYEAAQQHLERSARLFQMLGDRRMEANLFDSLGIIQRDMGDYATARYYFGQALAVQQEIGEQSFAAYAHVNLASVLLHTDPADAERCCREALRLAQETGNRDAEAFALGYLGLVHEVRDEWALAEQRFQTALQVCQELQLGATAAENVAGLARVALAQGRLEQARQYAEQCMAHLDAEGPEGMEFPLQVYLTCYEVLRAGGEQDQARGMLRQAYDLLLQRAEAISDPALREQMLQNVALNRRVLQLWQQEIGI